MNLIREGFVLQGASIKLVWFKPSSGLNPGHLRKCEANQFSVIRQVHYSSKFPDMSLDLVIGLNGIPIITIELKNEFSGQNVTHAVGQYCKRRESKDPLLKKCLVHFAVDNNTVLMTTKLDNGNTRFLTFNRDTKNPVIENKFVSSYLWQEILQADSLLEMLNNYQSTILDKGTDKQKLYNLKYEIEKSDLFSAADVDFFIELFVRKKVKSEVLSFYQAAIQVFNLRERDTSTRSYPNGGYG